MFTTLLRKKIKLSDDATLSYDKLLKTIHINQNDVSRDELAFILTMEVLPCFD